MELIPEKILFKSAELFADKEAVRDSHAGITYGSLASEIQKLARRLVATGLTRGGRCAIVLPNSIAFLRTHFAVIYAGAISVPCEFNISQSLFAQVLDDCRPDEVVIAQSQLGRLASPLLQRRIRAIVVADNPRLARAEVPLPENAVWIDDLVSERDLHSSSSDGLAALMYTTGSTGAPKGVVLTHENILQAIWSICDFIGYTPQDREVITLPLSHNFGLGHAYCNLANGGAIALENGLSKVGRVLDSLENFQATGFPGTPLGFALLMDRYGSVLREKGKKLRFIVVNSAALPRERAQQIRDFFPNVNLMVYYGLTEASRTTYLSLSDAGPSYYNSVGRPMRHAKIRIVDQAGADLPAGLEGEILIQGSAVTKGYWNKLDETRSAYQDSWFRSGDLGFLDEKGYLFLSGRLKDQINVGGYKVSPGEIEAVLSKCPGVMDVGVVGLDGVPGFDSEMVVAGIVIGPNSPFDPAGYEDVCAKALEHYKVPKQFVMIEKIPRTDTGKLKRHELVRLLKERLVP